MCTNNTRYEEVLELREGAPAITAYKAVLISGGHAYSQRGYRWVKGWNKAEHDITEFGSYDPSTKMMPPDCEIEGGAIHVSRTLTDAKRWVKQSQSGTPLNAVIEVLVNPEEIVGMGEANRTTIIDIAAKRCFVESFKPVYRYTRETVRAEKRAAEAKLKAKVKAKRDAKLKAKKKRKK